MLRSGLHTRPSVNNMGCSKKKATFIVLFLALATHEKYVSACGGCGGGRRSSPRNGKWTDWGSYGNCVDAKKTRYRACDPPPAHGGNECSGDRKESIYCNPCNSAGCQHICISSGGVVTCRCSTGYVASSSNFRKCVRNSCPSLKAPVNGEIWPTRCLISPRHGDSCFYRCKRGFTGVGTSSKSCSRGQWSSGSFNCQVRECPPVQKPDRGDISPPECKAKPLHGQKCLYECAQGFTTIGSSEVTCNDGSWTGLGVYCRDIQAPSFNETCPSAQTVLADEGKTSATVSWGPVIATDNDQALVSVSPNVTSPYEFAEGGHTLIYTATDRSGNTRFCHFRVTVLVLRCSVLFPPANGGLENAACGNAYGRVCRFVCHKGYELKGSSERKCDKKTGVNAVDWTGNTTVCEAIRCPKINTPVNSIQSGYGCTGPSSTYGTSCFFFCKMGYEAIGGSQRRTCRETKQWSGTQRNCQAITCPPLTFKSEGLHTSPALCTNTSATRHYLSECRFTCSSGYQLQGPGIKSCSQFKSWTPSENPSCKDIREPFFSNCPSNIMTAAARGSTSTQVSWSPPTATDNSGVMPNITYFGKQPGEYFSSGEHIIRYLASDRSGNVAECRFKVFVTVIRCLPKLYAPAGGTLKCTKDNQYGSECSLTCPRGRTMKGSNRRVCEKQPATSVGIWTGNETKCELVRCPRLIPPPRSIQSGCGSGSNQNMFGDKCLFYCDVGYQIINGSTERVCQANGTWSGEALRCQVVHCQSLHPPKDGDVIPSSCKAFPKYDTVCQFTCREGYRLNGALAVSCLNHGEWSKNITIVCKDVESPSFGLTCPNDIKQYADRATNYSTVTWPPVIPTDNSGKKLNLTSSGVEKIYYEGKHQVIYNATDEAGNYKICKFYITVEVIRCQTLLPPLNGFLVGDCSSTYGSTCKYNCNNGYNLLGSENVTCLHRPGHIIGYWDKPVPVCKVRTCSSLSAPQHGFLYPHMCTSSPVSGTTCFFECKYGYQSNGGIRRLQCGIDGKWNETESLILKCLDVTSPIFLSCPSDIRVSPSVNSTVMVNWTEPVAWDNSNLMPTVTVDPPEIRPPHAFNKTTLIIYTAMDSSGNKQHCSFKVILEADKGRVTVVMDKTDYHNKMDALVNDKRTYKKLKRNPTPALQHKLNSKLLTLKKTNGFDTQRYYRRRCSVPQPPKLYSLPKLSKLGFPMRPVVSFCGSPTYQLSKYLTTMLQPLTDKSRHKLQCTEDFINATKTVQIPDDYKLVSFDVKLLFTTIPLQLYFQYNGKHYKQLHGTAMGSPVYVVIAEIELTASRLAQWIERWTVVRETEGSSPGRTNTQGVKIVEKSLLPF
ncbi:CUB and sushi domain-containing protein 1 [Stylophora pistillata]|uniref:CUB and sushi domain-containing protein 1 n=1 Tax=Stylophora pistillata TaxID=50429 RepID=A0A2B4S220_STYPI|nr:CUB and sushi domain-containing protein 1 [Stylophora pistillata]